MERKRSSDSPGVSVPVWVCVERRESTLIHNEQAPLHNSLISGERYTLYEARQHFTPRLQQGVTGNNLEEPLQTLPSMLNHIITEPIGEHLPWERRYCDSGAFAFQDIPEVLEVGVSPAHDGMLQLEGGNVCAADNFIRGEHITGSSMGLRVADL